MSMTAQPATSTQRRVWLHERDCRVADLEAIVGTVTNIRDYPHADRVEQNVLIYDGADVAARVATDDGRREVQAELVQAFTDGPGLVVFTRAFDDPSVVDRATAAFRAMIDEQRAAGAAAGDHYAKPGANDRIWNAVEKLAVREPEIFAEYYANDVIALVCSAWLGPGYQVTSQINVVNPGGEAQTAHRDYHLGFQTTTTIRNYPAHVHRMTPMLTLQAGIAHSDMPVETGPTMFLPHSQKYELGYFAWYLPEFQDFFTAHRVQLPLVKGDIVFFNPAVMHAAGHNRTGDVKRMINLLQISLAFGKTMETIDHERMCNAVYPALLRLKASGASERTLGNIVATCADGYSFPTNLDRDQPRGSDAPEHQAEIVWRALMEGRDPAALRDDLAANARRRANG